ncbi:MAG: hypothetical protein WD039_07960 [Xanthobacteraceae bacterium]
MRSIAAILAAAAFFLASPAAAQQPLTYFGLTFPAKIGGAQIGSPYDFEKTNPGVGYSVEYLRPGWKINVYIYNLSLPSIPEDVQSELVRGEFELSKNAILKSPSYANVKLNSTYVITDASLRPRFLCATVVYKRQDFGESDSLLCVTSWKNKFIKYRLSAKRQKGSETEAKAFVEAWTKVLWPAS